MVRRGEDVQVVDHQTEVDLTAQTFMQIILEQEKKGDGLLPQVMLARLIQAGGDALLNLSEGFFAFLDPQRHVENEIERRLSILIGEGQIEEPVGERWRELLLDPRFRETRPAEGIDDGAAIDRDEIESLFRQMQGLEAELEQLKTKTQPTGLS